jgi:ribosome biogenesis GTPase A
MLTAKKAAAETMTKVDLVIEVLDARIPFSSCNPMVEALRKERQRPALKILNKSDLADPQRTRMWLDHYNAQPGVKAIAVLAQAQGEVARIPEQCLALAPHRGTREKPLRMMIMGVPNAGKSTLMNTLLKRRVAKVGDEPAVTKQQQRIELREGMSLIDTPGMLWPKLAPESALRLAACHSVGSNAFMPEDVAGPIGEYLLADYPTLMEARYGPSAPGCTGLQLLEQIALRRGQLGKGGTPDLARAALLLLGDLRDGVLGRITLETPLQVAARPPEAPRKQR